MKKAIFLLLILCNISVFAQVKKVKFNPVPVKLEKLKINPNTQEIAYTRKKILLEKNVLKRK